MIPTTSFGTWANITPGSAGVSPDAWVAEGLGEYAIDYDIEAITSELLIELERRLPAGISVLGNGELVGPAYGPEHDALPEDVCALAGTILSGDEDGEGGIDLMEIAEHHDLTERAALLLIYRIGADGERLATLVQTGVIDSPETAHTVLRDLDEPLDAEEIGGEPGDRYDIVVVDTSGTELRSERVTAQ